MGEPETFTVHQVTVTEYVTADGWFVIWHESYMNADGDTYTFNDDKWHLHDADTDTPISILLDIRAGKLKHKFPGDNSNRPVDRVILEIQKTSFRSLEEAINELSDAYVLAGDMPVAQVRAILQTNLDDLEHNNE